MLILKFLGGMILLVALGEALGYILGLKKYLDNSEEPHIRKAV